MYDPFEFDEERARRIEALYRSPLVAARRRHVIELLEARRGDHVLDVGVGPGYFAEDLARIVGASGRVVGIDTSDDMLAIARRRCVNHPNVEIQHADAAEPPRPERPFDTAVAAQVYEYVSDVPRALAALRGALRPGARAAIMDIDWATLVWEAADRERAARVCLALNDHCTDPHLPSRLPALLKAAGFEVRHAEPYVMFSLDSDPYVDGLASLTAEFAVGRNGVTGDEAASWLGDLLESGVRGTSFFSLTAYIFIVVAA